MQTDSDASRVEMAPWIAIQADRLLDGTGAPPLESAVVLVEDGRIRLVGRPDQLSSAIEDATRTVYDGCTILPGLIDCHVHLVFSAGRRPVVDLLREDDQTLLLRAVHNAQTALRAGVTTVKDLGDRGGVALKLRDGLAAGILPGPRILAAGPPITSPGGHCYWLGGQVASLDAGRSKIRELVECGVDLIKVMSSGGRMTVESDVCAAQFSSDALQAFVDEAHRLGRTVAAHGHGTAGIRNAVAAGVDVIEHCTWVSPAASNQVEYDEGVARQMARQRTFLDPTLSPLALNSSADPASLTPSQRESREIRPRVLEAHRRSIELGVEVAAGTDAGVGNTPLDTLPREVELLHEQLGLSPAQAIRAATYNAARSVKLEAEIGSIQPGRRADLLIVRGNPLDDLGALRNVRAVYRDGTLLVADGRLIRS